MIVNMYVDHMMSTPPASAEEVWNETRVHAKKFDDAARRIGLTPKEYAEFRNALLDGKAAYVRLPRRVDAMSGSRRGSVYAVRNAVMTTPQLGWRVALADGATVYVPQVCGNISLLRPAHIATAATVPHPHRVAGAKYVPPFHRAVAVVPPEQPVSMVPPVAAPEVPVDVPAAPPVAAQVVPAAAGNGRAFFFLIPGAIGGAIAGLAHHATTTTAAPPPPCSNGSNALGVCSGK